MQVSGLIWFAFVVYLICAIWLEPLDGMGQGDTFAAEKLIVTLTLTLIF